MKKRRVLIALDILLLGVFLLGYLAAWTPPTALWWMQPFGVLLPLTTIVVGLVCVVSLILGSWGTAGLHAFLVLLYASRLVGPANGGPVEADHALRIMTLNARFSWDVTNAFPDNTVDSLVSAEQPHIIALQEASILLDSETREIEMILPVQIRLRERGYRTYPPENDRRRLLNPVVTRIPISAHAEYSIPEPVEGRRAPTFSRTVVETDAGDVAIYNVHLRSFSGLPREERSMRSRLDPRSWPERWSIIRDTYRTHAEQVDAITDMLSEETLPYIVCGDLNSTPDNWSYLQLASVARDAWREAGGLRGATFPAIFPLVRIDYVFAGPGWSVREMRVAEPAKSDHRAVIADLAR